MSAQLNEDTFTVRTVHVFPSSVEAQGWRNAETLVFQNLDEYALLQEFNSINSATLDHSANTRYELDQQERQEAEESSSGGQDASSTPSAPINDVLPVSVATSATATSGDVDDAETVPEPGQSSSSQEVQFGFPTSSSPETELDEASVNQTSTTAAPVEATEPEPGVEQATDTAEETSTTTVLKRVGNAFALLVSTVSETLTGSSSQSTQSSTTPVAEPESQPTTQATVDQAATGTVVETPPVEESDSVDDQPTEDMTPSGESETVPEPEATTSSPTSTTPESNQSVPTTTEPQATTTSSTPSESSPMPPTSSESEEAPTTAPDDPAPVADTCTDDCLPFTLTLSNFGYPLEPGVEVSGAQLRLSFAAEQQQTREHIPELSIRYSFDGGTSWSNGGSIVIAGEASNSVNGGYYLFALPEVTSETDLSQLAIELSFTDDPNAVSELFVESAWLELFTLEPPEETVDGVNPLLMEDGFDPELPSGDRLELPNGEIIDFEFTDENNGETLIIKSSQKDYVGLTKTTTYFSVTNDSDRADEFTLQTYFPRGSGEVVRLREYEQNKPKEVVVPEYRPFVYHCEAGWEYVGGGDAPENIEDLSRQFSGQTPVDNVASETSSTIFGTTTTTTPEFSLPPAAEEFEATDSTSTPTSSEESFPTTTTTTVSLLVPSLERLLQFSTTTETASATSSTPAVPETATSTSAMDQEGDAEQYICRNTNIVRTCDSIEGENTACRVQNKKVAEHQMTHYSPGWIDRTKKEGAMPRPGFVRRALEFVGFGPDKKEVPESFDVRTHSDDAYTIQPGETKYYEMEIAFPPFSSGEYWIEAIGGREYGLLDPFWSSQWRYRTPITIDNPTGEELTEQQVFLELDSSLTGLWTNVQNDGGDIRFIQETDSGQSWYNDAWPERLPITIQSSQVDDDLSNFPVYVDLSTLGGDFWDGVQSDGRDIRITDSDAVTEFAYELVSIDDSAETGELYFNASTTISSTTDTTFYLYYGNGGATAYADTDPFGAHNAWNDDYLGVYHFDDVPDGTSGDIVDSSGTGNDGTSASMNSADSVTGRFGDGLDFADANDEIQFPDIAAGNTAFTVSYWVEDPSYIPDGRAFAAGAGGGATILAWPDNGGSGGQFSCLFEGARADSTNNPSGWVHHTCAWDGSDLFNFVNGVEQSSTSLSTTLSASTNLFGTDRNNDFVDVADELRLKRVGLSAAWVDAEYTNLTAPGTFYATSTAEQPLPNTFTELDHWVQHFDYSAQEADIWVQVPTIPNTATSTIYVYYGNSSADSTSDEFAPFTYSTTTDLYYVVNDSQTSPIVVYSLIDGNEVSIDGGTPVALDQGETTSFSTYSSSSVISALGPITARTSDNNSEPPIPISFASTTLLSPTDRGGSNHHLLSPFASTSVQTFLGNSLTADQSFSIATGSTGQSTTDGGDAVIIEATSPLLGFHDTNTSDSFVMYPPTTRPLYGIRSRPYNYSVLATSDVTTACSDLSSSTNSGVPRGSNESNDDCTDGSQGTGNAVRLSTSNGAMTAIQQADGDGTESSTFLPEPEFGTYYVLPQTAEYVSIACSPRFGAADIEVRTTTGGVVDSATCSPSGGYPGQLNFTPGTVYPQGYRVVSTNNTPFYIYYEDSGTGGETNTWSAVQGKQFRALDTFGITFGLEEENEDAQYEQLNYRWYENNDTDTPTTPWDLGEEGTAAEGDPITGQGSVNPGDALRLRMNLLANNGTGTVDSTSFALQYATAVSCSSVGDSAWQDLGDVGSTTAAFAGFGTPVSDGSMLPSTLLSDSDVAATFEEENFTRTIPNEVANGEAVEFDWSITPVGGVVEANTNYCFRVIRSTQEPITTYTTYPEVFTAGPPETPNTFKRFDNEHATSTTPVLEFRAVDDGGDNLDYQVQVSTDNTFGTTNLDRRSDVNFFDFENINDSSDKTPFLNGATIRFTPPSTLTNGNTYWWRVRAVDPDGSNTFSDWTEAQSFTINTGLTVSEWFQTTDEQFETNSLTSLNTSGSGGVELNTAGSNLIGEYGVREVASGATTTVSLNNSYTNPIVTASVRYPRNVPNGDQVSVRVFNKTSTSFEFRTFNDADTQTGTSTVDYVVMEAGDYLVDDGADGVQVFATSTTIDGSVIESDGVSTNPSGASIISFPTSFSAPPAVLTAVTTNNDPQWLLSSVYDGTNRNNPPTATQVGVYLHENDLSDGHGAAEDIDVIAFDIATGTNDGTLFEATTTATDITDTPNTKSFTQSFASAPGVIAVQQTTMTGSQGGWLMVDTNTPPTATSVTLAMEENTTADRGHAPEGASIVAFGASSGDIIRTGNGQMVSTPVDFLDAEVGNAWGEVDWTASGGVTVRVQYNTGSGFQNIPDAALPGNQTGFTSGPVNILSLDTDLYRELRLVATFEGVNPTLSEWYVRWGQRVDTPTLGDPFDNEKIADTTPQFDFTTRDPQGDDLEYEISISTDKSFASGSTTINSTASSSDFNNLDSGGDSSPFNSDEQIAYQLPASLALTDNTTYWWRVRAKDPSGADAFSPWSDPDSFTVDTTTSVSSWFQTTQGQFTEGVLNGALASTSDSVVVPSSIGVYGTTTLTDSDWQTITTDISFEDMVVVAKPSYDFDTSLENFRTVRVRNKTGNTFQIRTESSADPFIGTTTVDYIAMERGDWSLDDGGSGLRVIADTAEDVSDLKGNSSYDNGQLVTFDPPFTGTPPGAILTITSDNSSKWVTASMDDGPDDDSDGNEIGLASMYVGLEVSVDGDSRQAEDIDYLAFAPGSGTNDGTLFDMFNSGDDVGGSPTPVAVTYNAAFTTAPQVVLSQINGMDGGQGGTSIQETGAVSTNNEGQFMVVEMPSDNGHTNEIISVLAFEDGAGEIVADFVSTIASEEILFSDGAGPKFDVARFSGTTPGSSAVSVQVQYQTATGSWALIPDSQVSGNSSGNTSSPINLTGIDVQTYPVIRLLADLQCDGATCPTLDDWTVEWSEGVSVSGTLRQYDRVSLPSIGSVPTTTIPWNATDWAFYDEITIDASNVDETLTDFPVYVDLADLSSQFWATTPTSSSLVGTDIRVTTDSGTPTELPRELVTASSTAQTGELHFRADNISSTTDTTFRIYYNGSTAGDYTATSTYGTENVWTNNFELVTHDGGLTDSTANGYISTATGDPTTISSGQLGSAAAFDGDDYYEFNYSGVLGGGARTVTGWVRTSSAGAFTGWGESNNTGEKWHVRINTQVGYGTLNAIRTEPQGTNSVGSTVMTTGGWLHFASTYDGGTFPDGLDHYVNGALETVTASGSVETINTIAGNDVTVGAREQGGSIDEYLTGDIDELRIASAARSAGWMRAEYENQSSASTFYSVSAAGTSPFGQVRAAVNGSVVGGAGTILPDGSWTVGNVTAFADDVVTVFVDGVADEREAVSVLKYDGLGDMTGVELYEQHLSISSDETATVTVADLAAGDNSSLTPPDEDVFFNVSVGGDLNVCAVGSCADANLYVGAGNTFVVDDIGARTVSTHDFINEGATELDDNTLELFGSWENDGTLTIGTSEVIFTATTSTETLTDADGTLNFHDLTFGQATGTATFETLEPLDVNGDLVVDYGTLDRSASSITVAGGLTTGANGFWSGVATTTFDGNSAALWSDANPTSQNVGIVRVDGSAKTVTLGSTVEAESITIGADDTLNGGGSYDIRSNGDFVNNNVFVPSTSRLVVVGSSTNASITLGGSTLYALRASTTAGGSVSFTDSSVTLSDNLEIATGTVNFPTTLLRIGGSLLNTGGDFAHNNAEVRFTGSGVEDIQVQGTPFLNSFYDVSFTGTGDWSFLDSATTTNTWTQSNGSVTFPSGQLTVGRDFETTAPASFDANGGEVIFLVRSADSITSNGSSFNDVRFREGSAVRSGDYSTDWLYRESITIQASQVDDDLIDFPVYVDLSDFGSSFFTGINSDGGDIRVTYDNNGTEEEVAREIVFASTTAETGEMHFLAPELSSTSDTTFYVYYGNATATDYAVTDTYGRNSVWNSDYEAVFHLSDAGSSYVDSTGNGNTGTGEGIDPSVTAGKLGDSQDFGANGRIDLGTGPNSNIVSNGEYYISAWINLDNSSGDYAIISQYTPGDFLFWADNGGGAAGFCTVLANGGLQYVPSDCQTTAGQEPGQWQYVAARGTNVGGGDVDGYIYVDGATFGSSPTNAAFPASLTSNWAIGAEDGGGGRQFDGQVDEARLMSVDPGEAWITAEYRNQSTTTDFYTASQNGPTTASRLFAEASTDIDGTLVIESGQVQFPSSALTIGGSLNNNDTFVAPTGVVTFNATTGAHTIAAGSSTFNQLAINSTGGSLTVTENATATAAIDLMAANDFTLDFGVVLESTGTFSNAANGASTTWGGTLRLSGSDHTINLKSHGGDEYGVLQTVGGTQIKMWNSTASTYDTLATSSIYSQDHAGTDGALNIYGDYARTSGTEYWSAGTDFDGVALGTSSRPVHVRVENGGSVTVGTSSLSLLGTSTASTTVDALSGDFTMELTNATLTAQYFTLTGTDAAGLQLLASTTVPTFTDGSFSIGASEDAISVDAPTVDTNPNSQFFNLEFVSLGGSNVNVDSLGTPSSFWWFREGSGDRYGENFDNNDGNPGEIQWDDSNFEIAVSGRVFSDDGSTLIGGPVCDGSTANVRIVVDGGAYASSTSCDGGTSAYSFPAVSYGGDPTIVVYLDTDGGASGSVVTRTPTGDITDLDIYENRVMTRHEDSAPMTIARMTSYDESDDSDLRFVAATGTPDTLTVRPETELIVASSTTFEPGGNITIEPGGSTNGFDGSLHLDNNATFVAANNETHTIGGSFFNDLGSAFTPASSTFDFTATSTGNAITNDNAGTLAFHELTFTDGGGGWHLTADIDVAADMTIATGTVTGTGDITMQNGTLGGNGLLSLGGGTTTILTSTTLGGPQGWTFFDLVLGDGATTSTTTRSDTATTTIAGQLVIEAAHFLDSGASNWNLSGSGDVLVENGTLLQDTSTFTYSGGTGANVLPTTYYNLRFEPAAGTPTYTVGSIGMLVENDLTLAGSVANTLELNTNDPVVSILGDVFVGWNGTLSLSDTATTTISGSYDNDGGLTANGGAIEFDSSDAYTIAAGSANFADVLLSGAGAVNLTENATSTGVFTIASTSDFTLDPATTLAVGGQLLLRSSTTDWTDSTLFLYGGNSYTVMEKTLSESFGTLSVGANTQVRLWNSQAATTTVDATGSLYSQDHAGADGDLYVYGAYDEATRTDHWSYATDFDGEDLATSSSERAVDVFFAAGASASWSGGGVYILGTSTASTTIQNQGSGTYSLTHGGTSLTDWQNAVVRNIDSDGITFSGTPNVIDFDAVDLLVEINSAQAMTVAGSAITASPARTFNDVIFNSDTGVVGATNVIVSGSTVSGWRFTAHTGNLDGESNDDDPTGPAGDPGSIIWDDSAAIISISGNVYEADGTTESSVCDDVTTNIVLSIAGSIAQNASSSCSSTDGSYSISGVSFGSLDEIMVYIDGEQPTEGVTVSKDPISSIADMDIYENHVIVRHENTNPLTIADMAVWDSSDDSDIPYTAITGSPDTLSLPADTKLLVWGGKDFEPQGDMTLTGGGAGAAYDGSFEALANAGLVAGAGETHSIGGSFEFASNADFTSDTSEFIFTTDDAGRSITVNDEAFHDVTFNGVGSWSITDANSTINSDLTITSGSVTLAAGTTTIGGSFSNADTFAANGGQLTFTSSTGGETVAFGGSDASDIRFAGAGSWTITDTNATATGAFTVATGTVTLPSGTLAVGGDFIVSDTLTANGGELILTNNTGTTTLTLSGNDLGTLTIAGSATTTMTDGMTALTGDLNVNAGALEVASNTLSIAGSLDANGGLLETASSTINFNSDDTGEFIDPGSNLFYNLSIAGGSGGWTLLSATTSNDFYLTSASNFTLASGETLHVDGVFLNSVGGGNTTWSGSTVVLDGANEYSINSEDETGDQYDMLTITAGSDIRVWDSVATTTTVDPTSSLYSQDHAAVDGDLYIYGDFGISTTTEFWSYDRDFNGDVLTGGDRRAVTVAHASSATTTLSGAGVLQILGDPGATTTVTNQGVGAYNLIVTGGTLNAEYYALRNLTARGLDISGTPSISSLDYGDYELSVENGTLLTLDRTALNANPSFLIRGNRFATDGFVIDGTNVALSATSTNSWTYRDEYGDLAGEGADSDGLVSNDCGSIRWSDSSCQLVEQTEYRWRNDDGGIGVPAAEWYDTDWDKRQRVRIANNDNTTYSNGAFLITVPHVAGAMQSDFDDLRFTQADGTTEIDFWIERFVGGSFADVWVEVPNLPADDTVSLFMYYDFATAGSVSSSTATFIAADDFEDNDLSEYSGQTGLLSVDTNFNYGGVYGLELAAGQKGTRLDPGIADLNQTVSQGEIIRYRQYIDTVGGSGDEACTLFAVQTPFNASNNQNYGVCLELTFGPERLTLARDVANNDSSAPVTQLASTTVSYTTGWYEVEIDWQTDDTIDVALYNPSGSLVATTSAVDSTYTSGGFGFTSWGQNGGWDSFISRPRVETEPTVFFGAEQGDGGASYAAPQSTLTSGFNVGDVARLRVAIENTGLDLTGQEYRIEYAPKGGEPSCAAVDAVDYATVPVDGSCGMADEICMATSTNMANGVATTDLLDIDRNTFTAGSFVEDPSNQTSATNLDENNYTELEYALAITPNVSDQSYCFRVTNAGDEFDSYVNIPELSLQFDPVLGAFSLNGGVDISLTPGTTTAVFATGTVSDLNGVADLDRATTTFYRIGVAGGPSCTADNNNCYISTTDNTCSFTNCSGTSCDLECRADIFFHADPTDPGSDYPGEEWVATIEVADQGDAIDITTAIGVELLTMPAIDVNGFLDYGALEVNSDTGSFNASTTVLNFGNVEVDIDLTGSDLSDGASSFIPAEQQKFATSTFTYSACGSSCEILSSSTPVELDIELTKPSTNTPPVTDDVYWGIAIPFGVNSTAHTGTNTFTPIIP